MERAIAFILEQQAQVTTRLDSLMEVVEKLSGTVERLSGTVEKLSGKVDRTADSVTALLAIAEIHEREITELRQTQAEAQSRTDERLNALIDTVERHISEGRNGKA
jgi:chromosome segregation ATPase